MKRLVPVFFLTAAVCAQTGDDAFVKGRYPDAVAAFEQLADAQKSATTLNRLAMSYHLLGRFKEAEIAYERAIKADSGLASSRNNLGALFYSQRKFADADREFRRAGERNVDSTVLMANMHFSRYARDNERVARRAADAMPDRALLLEAFDANGGDFLAIVSLLPAGARESAALYETKGDVFTARKMFDDAVIEYKRSLGFDRYNATVVNRLGIAYHNLNKLRDAEQQYREALRLRPNYLDAMNNLAVIDYVRQDFQSALERYTRALKLQPRSATILRNMGACLFSLQRWDEGLQAYELALSVDPQLFDPRPGGAGTAIQMNQRNSALLSFYMAKLFASRGDKDRAISYLLSAFERGFDDMKMLRNEEAFKALVADERFIAILQKMEIEKAGPH